LINSNNGSICFIKIIVRTPVENNKREEILSACGKEYLNIISAVL
jgi:hypothetical protein